MKASNFTDVQKAFIIKQAEGGTVPEGAADWLGRVAISGNRIDDWPAAGVYGCNERRRGSLVSGSDVGTLAGPRSVKADGVDAASAEPR
ncbi:hypothetical protein [Leisingera methylohalidivorans]|uniref:Transposase n=1 Tax=Leisingera methylohalidivorans DSM 14336 TaxID=999552 RepID=V9W0Z7_9RHOB|nr:hypothetical protein METH_01990 [Leisingera methylohalidivorans DSM 14336]